MRAAVIRESRQVDVMTLEDPAPGPREVVVQVAACGICGTDLHILEGEFAPSLPIVPGHEFAGVVVPTGSDVGEIAVGQRVAVDPSLYCNECHYCRIGHNNLCERWNAIGVTVPGGAAEFAVAPAGSRWPAMPRRWPCSSAVKGGRFRSSPLACSRLTDNSQRGSAGMTIREELSCVPLLC
jgi:D-arabinose 1-dehydrogenase-like Zn-dependent alcohol dehydrogenase